MSQGWQEILYEVAERVATITLNRPEKLNAWTVVVADELRAALAVEIAAAPHPDPLVVLKARLRRDASGERANGLRRNIACNPCPA